MRRPWILLGAGFIALGACDSTSAQPGPGITLPSEWRITRLVPAPWAASEGSRNPLDGWIGQALLFDVESVSGPGAFECDHASMRKTSYAAESLFQGNLPVPAATAARLLGIAHLPRPGMQLTCSTGLFEFHLVDADTMLLGLDNQILTLSRSPGTQASAASPEGRVQRFLESHFRGDMAFSSDRMATHRGWFSRRLELALVAYFAKPAVADEVPAIHGDPFTDSQGYPTRFSVGKAKVIGDDAEVPVRFSDASRDRVIVYVLLRAAGKWRLDDVRLENGERLSGLMK